jgi:outer membrane protein OmpA-like peptidoglycan-associated protein
MLPDGSALPVLIVFDGGTVNISGAVPTSAAGQRLAALAAAYSKTPNAKVVSNLTVDPRVPVSTGVRVIEMNADRFDTGSSAITPQYAPELSRVVVLLKSMPSLTSLVVGHADQRGDTVSNLQLSEARASAVVDYLVAQGISADRLSSQGVGDQSPLTHQSDAAGLALNRRTEFVFSGLLVGS